MRIYRTVYHYVAMSDSIFIQNAILHLTFSQTSCEHRVHWQTCCHKKIYFHSPKINFQLRTFCIFCHMEFTDDCEGQSLFVLFVIFMLSNFAKFHQPWMVPYYQFFERVHSDGDFRRMLHYYTVHRGARHIIYLFGQQWKSIRWLL